MKSKVVAKKWLDGNGKYFDNNSGEQQTEEAKGAII